MTNDWPTQDQDLSTAASIIHKHVDYNEGEPLGLLEVTFDADDEKAIDIRAADWVVELLNHFCDTYGDEHGKLVTSKVITRVLLKDETIH